MNGTFVRPPKGTSSLILADAWRHPRSVPNQISRVAADDALTAVYRLAVDEGCEVIAARLADPSGEVLLVEVVDTPGRGLAQTTPAGFQIGGFAFDAHTLEEIIAEQRRAAEAHLGAARAALEQAGIGSVTVRILEGVPGPELVAVAAAEGCDAIVMATHGRSGLARTFLGSVANSVVRHVRGIPVVLIRPPAAGEVAEAVPASTASGDAR